MTAVLDIINRALTKLGELPIQSINDNTKPARLAARNYDMIRQNELRMNLWNFSMRRQIMAQLVNPDGSLYTPPFGGEAVYNLPTDCLRISQIGDLFVGVDMAEYRNTDTREYTVEGRQLFVKNPASLTNQVPTVVATSTPSPISLNIRYVSDVTDPNLFDKSFVEALACRCAMEWAEALTQSAPKRKLATDEYNEALRQAHNCDATENPPQSKPDNTWILVRVQ